MRMAQYYRSVSYLKGTEKTTGKMPFLLHLGQRYSPRICNTSGTSAFSFATLLAQVLSHLQHPWQSWCPLRNSLAAAGAPATPDTLPLQQSHLQHLCSVDALATSLQSSYPCNTLIAVGATCIATSLQCTFRNTVEHQQQQLDLQDARS